MSTVAEPFLVQALRRAVTRDPRQPSSAAPEPDELAVLLEAIAAGDEGAMAQLHRRTASRLRAAAYRVLRERELAEEAVQDAFLQIWQHAATYSRHVSAPMTWMGTIARNRAFDLLRQRERERVWRAPAADDAEYETTASEAPGPEERASIASDLRSLEEAWSELGASERTALELAFIEERTNAEVADAMGAPLGTVKCWIRRSLARMRPARECGDIGTRSDRPATRPDELHSPPHSRSPACEAPGY